VSLARENRARLYLLHVSQDPVGRVAEDDFVRRLESIVPPDAGLSCAPKAMVEFGEAAQKMTEVAEELMVDLIVLGPRQLHGLPTSCHMPSTTAQQVVSRSICPVLTVPAHVGEPAHASAHQGV